MFRENKYKLRFHACKYLKTCICESIEGKNKRRTSLFLIRCNALNLRIEIRSCKKNELLTYSLVNLQSKSFENFVEEIDFL